MRNAEGFDVTGDDPPGLPQLKRAIGLDRGLRLAVAVHPRQKCCVPWKHLLLVVGIAVHRRHHVAGDATVADKPPQVVGELVAPLLGEA